MWLSEEGSGDVASAQGILGTYAPELREKLGQVMTTRSKQLEEIRRLEWLLHACIPFQVLLEFLTAGALTCAGDPLPHWESDSHDVTQDQEEGDMDVDQESDRLPEPPET
jgi:hypothetical protein